MRLRPGPAGEAQSAPQNLLAGFGERYVIGDVGKGGERKG